jgi:hypothetical protein
MPYENQFLRKYPCDSHETREPGKNNILIFCEAWESHKQAKTDPDPDPPIYMGITGSGSYFYVQCPGKLLFFFYIYSFFVFFKTIFPELPGLDSQEKHRQDIQDRLGRKERPEHDTKDSTARTR